MKIVGRIFWLAEKLQLFASVGVIVHAFLSLLTLAPFCLTFFKSIKKKDGDKHEYLNMGLVLPSIAVLNILIKPWTLKYAYKNFIKQIPIDQISRPSYKLLLTTATTMYIIIVSFFLSPILNISPVSVIVLFIIGLVFMILPNVLNYLIIGSSCAYIDKMVEQCLMHDIETFENNVLHVIEKYKDCKKALSPHLFIVYTMKTLEIVLILYWFLTFLACLNAAIVAILTVPWIASAIALLCYVGKKILINQVFKTKSGFTVDKTYNNVKNLGELLRQELRMSKNKEDRFILKMLLHDIQDCEPFSALGFYSITRSTLTATLGTILTYCIVLIQNVSC